MKLFRHPVFVVIGAILLFVAVGVGWWLVSPLFISKTVVEEFPPAAAREGREKTGGMAAATKVKAGSFRDADGFHKGSGEATVFRLPDGSHLLRLENFMVTNGPGLHVFLARHADPKERADVTGPGFDDLGALKGNIGDQNYKIPAGVDPAAGGSVVIYCKPFKVIFSVAPLKAAP